MYTILYFSPTGNAKHIAQNFLNELGENDCVIHPMEKVNPADLEKNRHLLLIYSIHAFNAPRTVEQFMKKIPEGLYEQVSLIGVGCASGKINLGSSLKIKKILRKKNYPIIVDEQIAMPLTFILAFPSALVDKLIDESQPQVERIAQTIMDGHSPLSSVPIISRTISSLGRIEHFAARFFGLELHANKNCISCGKCWNNCPSKNITPNKKNRPHFKFSCLMCMRCIYECPQHAISPYFSKFIPIKKGYSISKYSKMDTIDTDNKN